MCVYFEYRDLLKNIFNKKIHLLVRAPYFWEKTLSHHYV
jgi:hypothetical protein